MRVLKQSLLLFLIGHNLAYAINPASGWYAGFIVGGSKAPDIDFNLVTPIRDKLGREYVGQGILTHSILGNVGGQLGFRLDKIRLEGEFFYNNNPYSHLSLGRVNIPNASSNNANNNDTLRALQLINNPFTFQGYTNVYAMMLNGLYDFYIPDYTQNWVPYLGVGLGYASTENNINFLINGSSFPGSNISDSKNNAAGQAIVGLSYYLNDLNALSLDIRYFSGLHSNTTNGQFSSFKTRPEFYSISLLCNIHFG